MTADELISHCLQKALRLEPVTPKEGLELLALSTDNIMPLMAAADKVRRFHKGSDVSLCSIINARSGKCSEDCAFCSQSVHATSEIPEYDLVDGETILSSARQSLKNGAHKFGIVTSGKGPQAREGDFTALLDMVAEMRENVDIHRCASLGVITEEQGVALKKAGLHEFHHNLETARSFYGNICGTRDYDENIATVRAARNAGLRVCCGGILGMGESPEQRIELAEELRSLGVDSIPLNFLNPVKGTKLENVKPLQPLEILKIIAVFRLYLPDKDIKVAGGREVNLRDLQAFMFFAGANSTMVGNYLTTKGRDAAQDLQLIRDLELTLVD
ncbi:MAG: biotin synthase BioB [Nitrospinae bacterium]|nr:biotin synthase BioB [Nitrospinota bacterium]